MTRLPAILGLLLVVMTACGTHSAAPVAVPGPVVDRGQVDETAKGAAVSLTVDAGDDWFSPTYIRATPGARITITVIDVGDVAHTFTVDPSGSPGASPGSQPGSEGGVDKVFGKKGDRATVTLVAPPPGPPLIFYCKYHQAAGMAGAIYSTPPS